MFPRFSEQISEEMFSKQLLLHILFKEKKFLFFRTPPRYLMPKISGWLGFAFLVNKFLVFKINYICQ